MPVIQSAKKKLRQDKKRQLVNKKMKDSLKEAIKKAKKNKSQEYINKAISIIDKSAKKHIIHKNKASRIKSSLAKLLPKNSQEKEPKKRRKTAKK